MRKLSKINEGLWAKGFKRSETGDDRLENKLITNIDSFKEIDMGFPFLFSDVDLIVNNSDKMSWIDLQSYMKKINEKGWRVPGWEELRKCFLKSHHLPPKMNDDLSITHESDLNSTTINVESKITNETLSFYIDNPYGQSYWCIDDYVNTKSTSYNTETSRILRIYTPKYTFDDSYFAFQNEDKDKLIKVRLVKDK